VTFREDFGVTGNNNSARQVGVTRWNALLDDIDARLEPLPLNPELTEGDASGANGAANSAALSALLDTLRAGAVNALTDYRAVATIRLPVGYYELDETIDLTGGTFVIEGASSGLANGRGTILKFPAGVTGIRTHLQDTSGAEDEDVTDHYSGTASIIRGLYLVGGYTTTEGEFHGIHLRSRAVVENCVIADFEGDGIYSRASATGGTRGNSNNSFISCCRIENCRNGFYADGTDANIFHVAGVDASLCRQWGFWDSSFLGNTFTACHAASNGYENGALDIAPTMVSDGTNRYGVIAGQEAGASTNAPSGTTADNTWWYYISAGASSSKFPLWVTGTTYRAGGCYFTDNANSRAQFTGCYAEDGQGLAQLSTRTTVLGGMAVLRAFEGAWISVGHFRPSADNTLDLGKTGATNRWRTIYGYTGDFTTQVKVNGTKVLGAQGAAIANATDAGSAITQLNLALAAMRTHGLIAT
jgi:hypothetical protein